MNMDSAVTLQNPRATARIAGVLYLIVVLAGMTVMIIERRWMAAAIWALIAAALSATGLMHGYAWTSSDTTISLRPAWPWVIGYASAAAVFASARWLTEPRERGTI